MALPGISNANEFYSAHYLESVLTGDIKKVRERWVEAAKEQLKSDPTAEISTPEQRFKALRKPWQKLREAEQGIIKDPAERLRLQRELFFQPLLEALGYPYAPKSEPVLVGGEAYQVPLLAEICTAKGEPWLWAVECFNPSNEQSDPLELTIAATWGCQIADPSLGKVLEGETWEELISKRVFGQDVPPRWVLAVSRDQLLLIDRQKWAASRLLRFELDTLLGDNNPDALLAVATILHREHTCPSGGGTPLLDELDENSHKHAYEVSTDLKYALRRSIELLGNEVVACIKGQKKGVFEERLDPNQLTLECLRYMYRLLFLFYIESRPDLGYAPMGSDVYRLGYSLESLREMDTAELGSEEDKEGTYISDSLDRLFQMIWEGYPKRDDATAQLPLADADDHFHDSFRLTPLKAHLFDPERLPIFNGLLRDTKGEKRWSQVRFRNVVLREVIELMSLTKEGKGKRRGRVSYSQLGINQLGAVYEALLSFRGFFAEEDLYEVQPAPKKGKATSSDDDDDFDEEDDNTKASGQAHDELEVGHFVTAEQLKAYKAQEIVPDPGSGKPKCYPKGSFIYRLAGRDREKSASYYTPESLTQCLVKYALKELLPGKTAADILQLKVCEPAMGSAAFLNEVVNQLAQAYLERRQQETGMSIPHERYATEMQKVKMRLADQNVFGVDLNPVAVELAEVSLWLNSIFMPENGRAFIPWFSQQLVCGNSLIGARRQIYRVSQLPTGSGRKSKPIKLWHEHAPEELAWDAPLPGDAIFHFLLPDPGMTAYIDKVIKELEPEAIEHCKRWNKAFVDEAFTEVQIAHLLRLSKLVNELWLDWAKQQVQLRARTTDPLPVWPDSESDHVDCSAWTPLKLKDRIQEQEVLGHNVVNTNARLRLKWAMDYWTALWFWPIRQAESLPNRNTWMLELSMILGDLEQGVAPELGQTNLFADTKLKQLAVDFSDRYGFVDLERLKSEFERLRLVEAVARRIRPLHWDLEFADLMRHGGFDLTVGNPPWVSPDWNKADTLSETYPEVIVQKWSASKVNKKWSELARLEPRGTACEEARVGGCENLGICNFLKADSNYLGMQSVKPDLYKNFILLCRRLCSSIDGAVGLLHPPGIMRETGGQTIRKLSLGNTRYIFQFENQLKLFADIGNTRKYCISISCNTPEEGAHAKADTLVISNLFHPKTIDSCFALPANALGCPGVKENGSWALRGHPDRIVPLSILLQDTQGGKGQSNAYHGQKLIFAHNKAVAEAGKRASTHKHRAIDVAHMNSIYLRSYNQAAMEEAGYIVKETFFPASFEELIISPRHATLGAPFFKAPKRICNTHRAFEVVNHGYVLNGGIPRSTFLITKEGRACRASWDSSIEDPRLGRCEFKLVFNEMVDPAGQRSLSACIMPSCIGHTNLLSSLTFVNIEDLLSITTGFLNILSDMNLRMSGSGHITDKEFGLFPYIPSGSIRFGAACARLLHLHSYLPGLNELAQRKQLSSPGTGWSSSNIRLKDLHDQPNPFSRRQALLELDVLVSMEIGLGVDDLCSAVRTCFPVLEQIEKSQYYDKIGNIVFTTDKSLGGVGLPRVGRENANGWDQILAAGESIARMIAIDDTTPEGPVERAIVYEAPFDRFFRSEEYIAAWQYFDEKGLSK
ncbi:hypothetical protein KBZ18_10935 [Synechococcus sp. Cruz-9H2]|uniref:Eco57I restriction-modification methylase domain-containing protein n=1 Tax=unclassified Synechococcus TaxID=2626047 RepID=UPI0020CEFA36|nr:MULTISPECIES: hypothetical protein [unclassified Synechococcus]MCP9820005.1 hypothetical protein [Synechococcus sp. Cruz-9H2]MCP9844311.1 hypothetical protein [Synechococcus sp. Edmonson 11F2]MCP9856435.1 hypothetical protein [Synechococcus sp. Cruz-9C9]MCP9863790.1 hypothetical protein [Synechococcus sp. Cruz-7E5]MCP9870915.1 hypothetical protein [Synechococcus sp. Cruz-7B9]